MDFELDNGFRVGDWEANPRQLTLTRDETRIRLEPKVMAVLVCLAEHPGEVVTRDEFADEVWKDRIVSDEVLSRDISLLRSHLGDDAREPKFIQTIPRRGYRLIAPVEPLTGMLESHERPSRRLWAGAAAGVIVVVIVGIWLGRGIEQLDPTTIAVLPFENLSDNGDAYFSDGLTEEILGALSRVKGLKVIAPRTSFALRDSGDDARSIGVRLAAGAILGGSVRRDGDRLKVTARLVDTNKGLQLWSQSYAATMADVFQIQDDISSAIVEKLVGTLQPEITVTPAPTTDLQAYHLFLRARHQIRRRGEVPVQLSIELYQQAIQADPEFGRAYVGLAEAYFLLPDYTEQDEGPLVDLGMAALARARELGADQSRAQALLGHIHRKRGEWLKADRQFNLALESAPDDSEIHRFYSMLLSQLGYMSQALAAAQRALELDPLSPVANQRFAIVSNWVGDVDGAAKFFTIANQQDLGEDAIPEAYLAVLLRREEFAEAVAVLKTIQADRAMSSDWVEPVFDGIRDATKLESALAAADTAYEQGQLEQTTYMGALYLLGASDRIVEVLMRSANRGEHVQAFELIFDDAMQDVRRHPRFAELVEAMGLVEYWQTKGWPPACRWNGAAAVCQ